MSDVEEADNTEYDHRPKYIRTSQGRVFQMHYFETRNVFTSIKTMVYSCNGLAPGQYSFPISFKTFEGWPASFEVITWATSVQHPTQERKDYLQAGC